MDNNRAKLDALAEQIAQDTCARINHYAPRYKDKENPYTCQYVLEEVVKILTSRI